MKSEKATVDEKFYRIFFLGILGISIVLRWQYLFTERLWPDEALYAWNAKMLFEHPGLIFSREIIDFHPPLFSVLMSFWHSVFPPQLACHAMVFFINIAGIIAIYFLGKKIQDRFLGCFGAIMLSFNALYFSVSSYILIDGVLSAVMIIFFYLLAGTPSKKIVPSDFYIGITVAALILLKWSGGLVLPLIVLYYLLAFPGWTLKERLVKISVPMIFGTILVVALIWYNYLVLGSWVPKVFSAPDNFYRQPFFYYCKFLADYFIGWIFMPFFLGGLFITLRSRERTIWVHGFWTVLALLIISLMSSKDTRFLLPILPSIVLVMGVAFGFLLSELEKVTVLKIFKPISLVLIFCFVLVVRYPVMAKEMTHKSFRYVGYQAAGVYVKEVVAQLPDTIVFASSPRMIRYYTDINFKEFGGNIAHLPEDQAEFIDAVAKSRSDIIIVVDKWEWDQPKWLYPLDRTNIKFLKSLGFKLDRIINKDVFVDGEKMNKEPVIWTLRRRAEIAGASSSL